MRTVNVDNKIDGIDNLSLSYNHEHRNFDYLIGKTLRANNMKRLGTIIDIDYYIDWYGHKNAVAVLDNGDRFNCRTLGVK